MQVTLLELPVEMVKDGVLVEEDLSDELREHAFDLPTHMVGMRAMHIGEDAPLTWPDTTCEAGEAASARELREDRKS
jgi:hypothetical protein